VDDLIEAILRLMDAPDDFVGPVNLGNPSEFTVGELAERIIALTGSRSRINYLPLPDDDPKRRQPDISLAKERLGWQPKVPLEEGLKRTIAYFERVLTEATGHGEK
jgi:UDP-glucuronate decarboxylase